MKKIFSYLSLILPILAISGALLSLGSVSAVEAAVAKKTIAKKVVKYDLYNPKKRYKDEKVEIANIASRCNTPALQKTHVKNLGRALEDGKPFGFALATATTTEPLSKLGEAYKKYLESLGWALEAMEEPYCGFGAFGLQAANKSYNKTVDRARERFLEAVKQDKLAQAKAKSVAAISEDEE